MIFCAGKVGGIYANHTYPAEFIHQNLSMAVNSIDAAFRHQVSRFLYLGSTCIYPEKAPQPMAENCLLSSSLEKTNEAYALAKNRWPKDVRVLSPAIWSTLPFGDAYEFVWAW